MWTTLNRCRHGLSIRYSEAPAQPTASARNGVPLFPYGVARGDETLAAREAGVPARDVQPGVRVRARGEPARSPLVALEGRRHGPCLPGERRPRLRRDPRV